MSTPTFVTERLAASIQNDVRYTGFMYSGRLLLRKEVLDTLSHEAHSVTREMIPTSLPLAGPKPEYTVVDEYWIAEATTALLNS